MPEQPPHQGDLDAAIATLTAERDAQIVTLTAERDAAIDSANKWKARCEAVEEQIASFGLQPATLIPRPFTPIQPTPHASLNPTDGRTGITTPVVQP